MTAAATTVRPDKIIEKEATSFRNRLEFAVIRMDGSIGGCFGMSRVFPALGIRYTKNTLTVPKIKEMNEAMIDPFVTKRVNPMAKT